MVAGQDITVTLMSERVSDEVQLEDDPRQRSTINVESFVDEQEWRLYREVRRPIIYKLCSTVLSLL